MRAVAVLIVALGLVGCSADAGQGLVGFGNSMQRLGTSLQGPPTYWAERPQPVRATVCSANTGQCDSVLVY